MINEQKGGAQVRHVTPSSCGLRRIPFPLSPLVIVSIAYWCLAIPAHSMADLINYSQHNLVQVQTVVFATADETAVTLSGTVGPNGPPSVYFHSPLNTAVATYTPRYPKLAFLSPSDLRRLHWSQRAAQISGYDSTGENTVPFDTLVITFQKGWGAKGIEFKVRTAPRSGGTIRFFAFDMSGELIAPFDGSNSFDLSRAVSGEVPYRAVTTADTLIHQICINGIASDNGSPAIHGIGRVAVQGVTEQNKGVSTLFASSVAPVVGSVAYSQTSLGLEPFGVGSTSGLGNTNSGAFGFGGNGHFQSPSNSGSSPSFLSTSGGLNSRNSDLWISRLSSELTPFDSNATGGRIASGNSNESERIADAQTLPRTATDAFASLSDFIESNMLELPSSRHPLQVAAEIVDIRPEAAVSDLFELPPMSPQPSLEMLVPNMPVFRSPEESAATVYGTTCQSQSTENEMSAIVAAAAGPLRVGFNPEPSGIALSLIALGTCGVGWLYRRLKHPSQLG